MPDLAAVGMNAESMRDGVTTMAGGAADRSATRANRIYPVRHRLSISTISRAMATIEFRWPAWR
jgi:hypothetical protein